MTVPIACPRSAAQSLTLPPRAMPDSGQPATTGPAFWAPQSLRKAGDIMQFRHHPRWGRPRPVHGDGYGCGVVALSGARRVTGAPAKVGVGTTGPSVGGELSGLPGSMRLDMVCGPGGDTLPASTSRKIEANCILRMVLDVDTRGAGVARLYRCIGKEFDRDLAPSMADPA